MLLRCLGLMLFTAALSSATDPAALIEAGLAAEARLDSAQALTLFQQADAAQPNNAFILQKIARQYSDLVIDQSTTNAKRQYAETALSYARRAAALRPDDPVNALSLAICYGKLALSSDTSAKISYARLIKQEAERALALDPQYAWAHHVLGRWHGEVAELGFTAKFFVRFVHGGLPPANLATGIAHLKRATELDPTELTHFLELGFAHAANREPELARAAWLHGLAMPSRGKHDEVAKQRARDALAQLK